ncbi:hypothetical protein HYT02_05350 [Candidatus Gottesmanbacteria bacterium]|nr:hypothetical protein [Candidatus Gottesmanbacteria bacterium]
MRKVLIPIIIVVLLASIFILSKNSKQQEKISQESNSQAASQNTPENCSGKALIELTEGPYYKTGSPEREKIAESNTPGEHLILKGYVFDTDCKSIANAWLDFWQADGEGNYDNLGYNLRGHQYTDENGFFRIETIVPGQYPGRTEHIHFKVRKSENSSVITSQLFFPDSDTNSTDTIFDDSLIVEFGTDPDGSKFASYNIIVP